MMKSNLRFLTLISLTLNKVKIMVGGRCIKGLDFFFSCIKELVNPESRALKIVMRQIDPLVDGSD